MAPRKLGVWTNSHLNLQVKNLNYGNVSRCWKPCQTVATVIFSQLGPWALFFFFPFTRKADKTSCRRKKILLPDEMTSSSPQQNPRRIFKNRHEIAKHFQYISRFFFFFFYERSCFFPQTIVGKVKLSQLVWSWYELVLYLIGCKREKSFPLKWISLTRQYYYTPDI